MSTVPKDLMKQYVRSQNFTSTTEIMQAIKDMFKEVIQQVMESELDQELGYLGATGTVVLSFKFFLQFLSLH